MFNMASSRLTDELFERALSDSPKDFPHIPCLKDPLVAIMKDHVEEMIRLGLKAFGIGLGENDQNVICFQARLMSTLTLFMVVQRVGVLPSGRKH